MMSTFQSLFAVLLCLSGLCIVEADVLDTITAKHRYEQYVRPKFYDGEPVNISVRFEVISANDIDVQRGDFLIDVNFFFRWQDDRLKFESDGLYDHDTLSLYDDKLVGKVWLPDVFIVNAKDIGAHSMKHLKITNNGSVTYMIRLSVRLACTVDLELFPWDTQHCSIIIQSYSHSIHDIVMEWVSSLDENPSIDLHDTYVKGMRERPMAQLDLGEFQMLSFVTKSIGGNIFQTDNKTEELASTLEAVFVFNRLNGFYLIQTLGPSNILVVLSWVAFLIEPEESPPRVFLGISCILTMAAIQNYINTSLPKVSYIKVIDIYCLTCYFFVVLVMVEYAVVLLLNERVKKEKIFLQEKKLPRKQSRHIQQISSFCKFWPNLKLCMYGNPFCMRVTKRAVRLVDKLSMILFPISYIIFNIAYWTYVAGRIAVKEEVSANNEFYA